MKSLLYKLFALIFNISRVIPVKKGRIALLAPHPREKYDSLSAVKEYLKHFNDFHFIEINVPHNKNKTGIIDYFRFFIIDSVRLARAEYIFLNDNFMPLADLNISKKTVVTQLWHGEGAFKKFGLLTNQPEEVKERLINCSSKTDHFICTSENIIEIYAEAFGTQSEKILPLGSPRTDYLLNLNKNEIRKQFDIKYPIIEGKKLILYAPTFRDNADKDMDLLKKTDFHTLKEKLCDEYIILLKLHPAIHSAEIPGSVIDVTEENITELTLIADLLITDYSSVCMNFAFLNKPTIFYAFDLDEYNEERSFCCGYEDYVPGPVITDFIEIPDIIKNSPDSEKNQEFREFNFDHIDNLNTKRTIESVIRISRASSQ